MNVCGPVVARALRHLGVGPADLVLVYDDIDLPLGAVRTRMKGSHGGHNGVRSVIEALGTSEIRRVDRKSTRLNSSHGYISYAVFCLKKKKKKKKMSHVGLRTIT